MKMCCAITPNALHKNDSSELTCQYRQNLWLLLGLAAIQRTFGFCCLCAEGSQRRQYLNCRAAKTTILAMITLNAPANYTCVFPFLDLSSSIISGKIWSTLPSLHTTSDQYRLTTNVLQ